MPHHVQDNWKRNGGDRGDDPARVYAGAPHERATREQPESYFSTGRYGKLAGRSLVRLRCAQSTTITDLINPAGFSNNA